VQINHVDENNETALHRAVRASRMGGFENERILQLLRANGALVDVPNAGSGALQLAKDMRLTKTVLLLLQVVHRTLDRLHARTYMQNAKTSSATLQTTSFVMSVGLNASTNTKLTRLPVVQVHTGSDAYMLKRADLTATAGTQSIKPHKFSGEANTGELVMCAQAGGVHSVYNVLMNKVDGPAQAHWIDLKQSNQSSSQTSWPRTPRKTRNRWTTRPCAPRSATRTMWTR
jgi:autotransporter adhesin